MAGLKPLPSLKKLAAEKGINIAEVHGSGDSGRIIKKDVDSFVPAAKEESKPRPAAPQTVAAPAGQISFDEVPVSQMRKIIAKRLTESMFTAPHFYLTIAVDMDNAVASRTRLNAVSPVKISYNDMVLKAAAVALKLHPKVNSSWLGDKIRFNHHVNIGVAVASRRRLAGTCGTFCRYKISLSDRYGSERVCQKSKRKKAPAFRLGRKHLHNL